MSETLGSLVDKLSITNLKLYVVQERVFDAAKAKTGIDAETVQKLASLNLQRNRLMSEIDGCLDAAVKSGHADVDDRVKL